MTTYLRKSCSFCLPRVPFVNCRQFMYLVISLLVLRAGYGIWLYQFLIIAYLFTLLHLQQLVVVWRIERNLFAFKEFMRGCIKCFFKIQYECVNLSSIVQDFSPIIHQDKPWYLSILCVQVTCKVHKSRKPGNSCTHVSSQSAEDEVKALKMGKSAGVDNIPAELVQAGGEAMIDILTQSELPRPIKIRPWMYVRHSIMYEKAAFCAPEENSSVAR